MDETPPAEVPVAERTLDTRHEVPPAAGEPTTAGPRTAAQARSADSPPAALPRRDATLSTGNLSTVVQAPSAPSVPGYEVRLVDEKGGDVPDGELGEMLVSGPSAADGYWNQREKSRSTFEGGWTRSGDKYTRDADGFYTYQGRTDDMFKVSGIWVSPFEVESALIGHDAVLEAAVVPKEDADGLVKPKAFIVLKPGKSAGNGLLDELKEHVKAKAGMWKYPRWIELVDGLPKTATGKIQRFKLREG